MSIDDKILAKRVIAENPWWKTKKIPFYADYGKRAYYPSFYEAVTQTTLHRAVVLMGPRRVGKTVMMYQSIQDLIDSGVNAQKILYFSLDTPIYTNVSLEELIEHVTVPRKLDIEGCYIYFDEIQYLKDWEVHLKNLVDRYRSTKFIVSGSAAATLRMKSIESGAGRFSDFFLPPLTFAEYVDLNAYDDLLHEIEIDFRGPRKFYRCEDIDLLNQHFKDYINYGGFPEIAIWYS